MKQREFLKNKFEAGQLSHAYVFSGQDMDELKQVAKELVTLINKDVAKADSLIEKGNFPDLFIVKSENSKSSQKDGEDKQEIDVALIREVQHFLSYKPYYEGYKTVIIEYAERMNMEAQNCFLKNLEEPKGKTLIVLLCLRPEMLLPTIFSRCQQLKFSSGSKQSFLPQESSVLQGLLKVIDLDLAEKFLYAKNAKLDSANFTAMLQGLQKYFRQLLLGKIGAEPLQSFPLALQQYPLVKIKKILTLIERMLYHSLVYNSSSKLALEILLMEI